MLIGNNGERRDESQWEATQINLKWKTNDSDPENTASTCWICALKCMNLGTLQHYEFPLYMLYTESYQNPLYHKIHLCNIQST